MVVDGTHGAVVVVGRDQRGNFLGASAITFRYIAEPTTLEASAVREGLSIAEDLFVTQIQVAWDCLTVVKDITHNSSATYGAIVHEIRERSHLVT